MKCSAPCIPQCEAPATHEVLNKQSTTCLGHNCDIHAQALPKMNEGKDYTIVPLIEKAD